MKTFLPMPVKAVFSISIASIAPGAAGANVLHGLALSEGVFPSQLVATLIFSTFYKIDSSRDTQFYTSFTICDYDATLPHCFYSLASSTSTFIFIILYQMRILESFL